MSWFTTNGPFHRRVAMAMGLFLLGSVMSSMNEAAAQAVDGDLRVVRTINESVFQVAWTPDGTRVAALLGAGGYAVWDAQTGRKVAALSKGYGAYTDPSLAFAPDGKHLLVRPTGALKAAGSEYSAEGRILAVLFERDVVVVYDTVNWQPLRRFSADPAVIGVLAVDPSGSLLALGGETPGGYRGVPPGRIWIHEAATGRLVTAISGVSYAYPKFLAFLDGGRIASITNEVTQVRNVTTKQLEPVHETDHLRIWDLSSGRRIASFDVPNLKDVYSMSASHDGHVVAVATEGWERSGGAPSTFRVWNVASGREVGHLTGNRTYFTVSAVSPDGRRVVVAEGRLGGDPFAFLFVDIGG